MSPAIVAFGAISGLGAGREAISAGATGEPPRVAITHDALLAEAGLARPFVARIVAHGERASRPARAGALLDLALAQCLAALDDVLPGWRARRIGLALGTSSGSMLSADAVFADLASGRVPDASTALDATYFGPLGRVAGLVGAPLAPATLVLTACAASTLAIGLGARWLEADACDVVLVGGFDEISTFVASGFEVLRATTGTIPPRPFGMGRDGMSLGEGAGVLALVGDVPQGTRALAYVTGFGASADAVHLTAPDRTGSGLARAAKLALGELPGVAVNLVSTHATATPFNDAAEASAIRLALGPDANPLLFAYKAQIGHALGAAGVLESLACVDAIVRGLGPATPIAGPLEPDLPGRILAVAEPTKIDHALKLSAAFGGANAALVLSREPSPRPRRAPRAVYVRRAVSVTAPATAVDLAAALGATPEKVGRADALVRTCLGACLELVRVAGPLGRETGVVVGHSLATLETNVSFASRLAERGPRGVEPRKFPYTSPNAASGECGALFEWTGPGLAVGGGLHGALEALVVAVDLVRAGDADRLVVIGVDEVGDASRAWLAALLGDRDVLAPGAVALVVSASPEGAFARVTAAETRKESPTLPARVGATRLGHRALLPLTEAVAPAELVAVCPWGGSAKARFSPV